MKSGYLSFHRLNRRTRNNIAFISPQRSLTFQALFKEIVVLSGEFQKRGITAENKVAILSKNSLEYILSILALFQMGAIAVPINIHNPTRQIISQLNKINCKKLMLSMEFRSNDFPKDWQIIEFDTLFSDRLMQNNLRKDDRIPLNQLATILFTSGSSGEAKAVVHTIGNHYFSALGSNLNIPLSSGKRWLLSLPLYHVGGMAIIFRTLLSGSTTVISDENISIPHAISKYNISHLSLVPTQLMRLIQEPENIPILKQLNAILLGGSYVHKSLIEQIIQKNLPVHTSYGSTEMSSQITTTSPGDGSDLLYTSGEVLKYRRLKIGNDGEILVKGETLFKGYLAGNQIKNKLDKYGWFPSGDLGQMNSGNYLTVLGRKDSMFISGGENIYPEEIEKQLMQVDGILEAMVIDVPDEIFGARPVAFVKVKENTPFEMQSIQKSLQEKIARFKIPKHIFNLPDDFNEMKLNRSKLRKLAMDQLNNKGE